MDTTTNTELAVQVGKDNEIEGQSEKRSQDELPTLVMVQREITQD